MIKNEKGQALIELIIFLPFMFTLYFLISGFANAINGSINQQKITRAYFYYRLQNNSTIPKPSTTQDWSRFGMFFVGWKERFSEGTDQGTPVMPCYKITIPLKPADQDKCEEKYSKPTSQFIRVATAYGICGGTYRTINGNIQLLPDGKDQDFLAVIDPSSCSVSR